MENRPPELIKLPLVLKKRMLAHALAEPEVEVCGLAGGSDNLVTSIYPVINIAEDPGHRFLMGPEAQIESMRRIRETGEEMIGIYHSHPDSAAEPSAIDLEMAAYPDLFYFIISLQSREPQLLCFFYDGRAFSKTGITLV